MRFSHFFIDRPIFAAAVSVVITLIGLVALLTLPMDQYPQVAPPTVTVSATYPGATAEEIAASVAAPLEQQINGIDGMIYMSSTASGEGRMSITVTFTQDTDPDIAQVEVQNRIQTVLPQLPQEVRDLGITVRKSVSDMLMNVHVFATSENVDREYIANFAGLQVKERLLRTAGVGDVVVTGARDYAMRVWIDPEKAASHNLTVQDVVGALRDNNLQIAGGAVGGPPFDDLPAAYQLNVMTRGRLTTPVEFEQAIIKRDSMGRLTRVSDVARVELGAQNYAMNAYKDGEFAVALRMTQAPNSNAIQVGENIRKTMRDMEKDFPPGITYDIIYSPVAFTAAAVKAVQHSLVEALILAVAVVLVFLQRWRTALIPLLAIPISLIGTLAVMLAFGFSLNNLSMFALVLSIGIVVDDAIVVVENVERHLRAGMAPADAAHLTMDEVGGALIGIALVLVAVFVPTAFLGGIAGQFYKQFALTIASATLISLLVSLTLSPALAAQLLKPHGQALPRSAVGQRLYAMGERLNGWMDHLATGYGRVATVLLRRSVLVGVFYFACVGLTAWRVMDTPRGFIPVQDQANVVVTITMPPGASLARTDTVVNRVIPMLMAAPGVSHVTAYTGMDGGFGGASNAANMWVMFEPFEQRIPQGLTAQVIAADLRQRLRSVLDADARVTMPASVRGLGSAGGFKMMVQDRGGYGYRALEQAVNQLIEAARKEPALSQVFTNFNTRNPSLEAVVDRDKAEMLGVSTRNVYSTLQTYLAGTYVNNINLLGHTFQVIAQGDSAWRQDREWIGSLRTRSSSGAMVPIEAVATLRPVTSPYRVLRYNLYPAADIQGDTAPGYSSGEALAVMERLAAQYLPAGMGFEWTDAAYQQRTSGNAGALAFLLAVAFVFIFLAALYESLTLPLAVILIVPMCLLAALGGVSLMGMDNNILTQIGMVVLVGLAAKNAILIVEFARQAEERDGMDPVHAAIAAARTRLRPILMTSAAFIFGVIPLAFGSGPGAELRQALGVAVFWGMIGVTLFGLVFTPVFYVFCRRLAGRFASVPKVRLAGSSAHPATDGPAHPAAGGGTPVLVPEPAPRG